MFFKEKNSKTVCNGITDYKTVLCNKIVKYFVQPYNILNWNRNSFSAHINGFCKSKNNGLPKALVTANGTTRTKVEMAELLQEYIHKEEKYLVPTILKKYVKSNKKSSGKFVIPPISEIFVENEMKRLNVNKSTGDDNINDRFLQLCTPSVVSSLTLIINESIRTSVFPSAWKTAKVTALHKSGSDTELNNYRPNSVLNAVTKIIERHVYNHMYRYFTDNHFLSSNQSGFRAGFTCETCLLKITNNWYEELNKGNIIGCVTLDLTKAFDVLNFDIFLKKLQVYECHDNVIKWFQSYLKERKQYVNISNVKSKTLNPLNGIPQGSILGPLIFSIYINDLPLNFNYVNSDLYADDTTLYVADKILITYRHNYHRI